jgi:hypothetical protein
MTIAEKLIQIAENELKVYEAGRQSAYETIVFAQDCTNAQQVFDILSEAMTPADKIVMFVNKAWTVVPNSDTVNNQGLWMMCLSTEFNSRGMFARWRDGLYYTSADIHQNYDYTVSAGEEWLKVVLL